MPRTRWMTWMMLSLVFLFLASCGGGSGTNPDDIPEDFNDLATTMNKQSKALGSSLKSFADKYNALSIFDPSTATGDAIVKPLRDLNEAGEKLESDLTYYRALLDAYHDKLSSDTSASTQATKAAIQLYKQSVDPLLVSDIGNLIAEGKTEADAIQELIDSGEDPDAAYQALNDYKTRHLGNAFRTGVTAIVGSGAGAIAGLAAATAGAPVLVITGLTIGTGVVVGAIWSWCTEPTTTITKALDDTHMCAMASGQAETVELSNGENGVALALPQGGPGALCLHVDGKAPICFNTTIGADGNTIVTGCFVDAESGDAADAASCETTTEVESGITILGTDCAKVTAITAAGSGSSSGGYVTATAIPPTEGCTVSYDLVGTDGYTQSGSPVTDGGGQISFSVPAGAEGVHDAVDLTLVESGAQTSVGYTF